ncbi:MAG: hypothetical protein HPY60_11115 [Candidatus Methanofastidiosum sp.]|nr:hypothetical protein [Methanofastidiosum sp.]
MRRIIIYILTIFITGCQTNNSSLKTPDKKELEYCFINLHRHSIDTLFKTLIEKEYADSIFRLSYMNFYQYDTFNQRFEFPLSNSTNIYHNLRDTLENRLILCDKKLIWYNSNEYIVYKYLFDEPLADDEEMHYFFVPEFGIVVEKSAAWGNYLKLIDNGNNEDSDDILFINEMIIFDSDFFHK